MVFLEVRIPRSMRTFRIDQPIVAKGTDLWASYPDCKTQSVMFGKVLKNKKDQ
jgi:hypothetical protein